jgi:hypothetical protein
MHEDKTLGDTPSAPRLSAAGEPSASIPIAGCICHGNWRLIVGREVSRIGKTFIDDAGAKWTFFGIVHSDDDYYYGMGNAHGYKLLSCVGSIEAFGYEQESGG